MTTQMQSIRKDVLNDDTKPLTRTNPHPHEPVSVLKKHDKIRVDKILVHQTDPTILASSGFIFFEEIIETWKSEWQAGR